MKDLNLKKDSNENFIFGRNAVCEALKSGRNVESVLLSCREISGSLKVILSVAKERKIPVKHVKKDYLDEISGMLSHQGVAALVGAKKTCKIDDILEFAKSKNEPPFVIVADGIEDPHNLGAIIRTAECSGVHGIIIPSRRAVGLTAAVDKASAGALEHMLVAKVGNIGAAIDELKEKGLWIYGADMDGESWNGVDLKGAVAIVIGSEGFGIGSLVRKK